MAATKALDVGVWLSLPSDLWNLFIDALDSPYDLVNLGKTCKLLCKRTHSMWIDDGSYRSFWRNRLLRLQTKELPVDKWPVEQRYEAGSLDVCLDSAIILHSSSRQARMNDSLLWFRTRHRALCVFEYNFRLLPTQLVPWNQRGERTKRTLPLFRVEYNTQLLASYCGFQCSSIVWNLDALDYDFAMRIRWRFACGSVKRAARMAAELIPYHTRFAFQTLPTEEAARYAQARIDFLFLALEETRPSRYHENPSFMTRFAWLLMEYYERRARARPLTDDQIDDAVEYLFCDRECLNLHIYGMDFARKFISFVFNSKLKRTDQPQAKARKLAARIWELQTKPQECRVPFIQREEKKRELPVVSAAPPVEAISKRRRLRR